MDVKQILVEIINLNSEDKALVKMVLDALTPVPVIETKKLKGRHKQYGDATIKRYLKLLDAGVRKKEIVKRLGISHSLLYTKSFKSRVSAYKTSLNKA
jgi:hypothetical protein